MRTSFPTAPLILLAATTLASEPAADEPEVDFEALGRSFVEEHCPDGSVCPLDDVLKRHYKRADVGAFDVFFPSSGLADGRQADLFAEAVAGLFEAQRALVDWLAEDPAVARELADDVELVTKWIRKWRTKDVKSAADSDEEALWSAMQVDAEISDALARIRAVFDRADELLGIDPRHDRRPRLLLCPRRRDFVETVGFMGLSDDALREEYWADGVEEWTYLWWGWTVILALEYSPWSGFDPEFRAGKPMNELSKTGLVEHTNQQALKVLFYHWFAREDPRHEEKGLAINLAIEVSGSANTLDGEGRITTTGAATAPYSRFVPGGNPNGGVLPAISAAPFNTVVTSEWRKGDGEDFFVGPLRKGQKEGAKVASKERDDPKARDPLAHFLLKSREGGKHVVSAPFFGPAASQQQYPPAEFMNDYRELYRSYLTCFLYWLRTHGAGSAEDSAASFRKLVRGMDELNAERTFDQLVEEVYGVPISAANDSVDSLEWQFLGWLPKGRVSR